MVKFETQAAYPGKARLTLKSVENLNCTREGGKVFVIKCEIVAKLSDTKDIKNQKDFSAAASGQLANL